MWFTIWSTPPHQSDVERHDKRPLPCFWHAKCPFTSRIVYAPLWARLLPISLTETKEMKDVKHKRKQNRTIAIQYDGTMPVGYSIWGTLSLFFLYSIKCGRSSDFTSLDCRLYTDFTLQQSLASERKRREIVLSILSILRRLPSYKCVRNVIPSRVYHLNPGKHRAQFTCYFFYTYSIYKHIHCKCLV